MSLGAGRGLKSSLGRSHSACIELLQGDSVGQKRRLQALWCESDCTYCAREVVDWGLFEGSGEACGLRLGVDPAALPFAELASKPWAWEMRVRCGASFVRDRPIGPVIKDPSPTRSVSHRSATFVHTAAGGQYSRRWRAGEMLINLRYFATVRRAISMPFSFMAVTSSSSVIGFFLSSASMTSLSLA